MIRYTRCRIQMTIVAEHRKGEQMVEDKLISKNKLLMYLADLQLAYSPVYGKGDAVIYNFIRSLSDMIELWEDEATISKTESVENEDCVSRQYLLNAFGLSEKTRKYGGDHSGYDTSMLYEIQDVIEDAPSVNPIPNCDGCNVLAKSRFEYINACKTLNNRTPDTRQQDIYDAYAVIKALQPIFGDEVFE